MSVYKHTYIIIRAYTCITNTTQDAIKAWFDRAVSCDPSLLDFAESKL